MAGTAALSRARSLHPNTSRSEPPGPPLLHVESLTLHFDQGSVKALDGVDMEVREGEFVAITGPSGCGKSSLLSLLGTLEMPTSGDIHFRSLAYSGIRDLSLFRRRHIGFIFQSFHLMPTLSAWDNVLIPTVGGPGAASDHRERARALLSKLDLQARLDHFPSRLSGGERQRVAIARALVNDPDLILADEPTGSLDSHSARQVLDLLTDIRKDRGLTLILVTHDPVVAARADRQVSMRDGRIERRQGAAR